MGIQCNGCYKKYGICERHYSRYSTAYGYMELSVCKYQARVSVEIILKTAIIHCINYSVMITTNNKPLERLKIFSLKGVQMKTFHITWFMFFICFFGWFGLA